MYTALSEATHDRAAQMAVLAAHLTGEKLMVGELKGPELHAAFEAVVMHVSQKNEFDVATTAAQLLSLDKENKAKAIKIGFAEISRVLGGEDRAMAYFRVLEAPRENLRFSTREGTKEDMLRVKNKLALLAFTAQNERFRKPDAASFTRGERELINYLKSLRRTIEGAIDDRRISAEFGRGLMTEFELATIVDKRPDNRRKLEGLQIAAATELYEEAKAAVTLKYKKAVETINEASAPGPMH